MAWSNEHNEIHQKVQFNLRVQIYFIKIGKPKQARVDKHKFQLNKTTDGIFMWYLSVNKIFIITFGTYLQIN